MSVGALLCGVAFAVSLTFIGVGCLLGNPAFGHLGVVTAMASATLLVLRDNRQTRRMLRTLRRDEAASRVPHLH